MSCWNQTCAHCSRVWIVTGVVKTVHRAWESFVPALLCSARCFCITEYYLLSLLSVTSSHLPSHSYDFCFRLHHIRRHRRSLCAESLTRLFSCWSHVGGGRSIVAEGDGGEASEPGKETNFTWVAVCSTSLCHRDTPTPLELLSSESLSVGLPAPHLTFSPLYDNSHIHVYANTQLTQCVLSRAFGWGVNVASQQREVAVKSLLRARSFPLLTRCDVQTAEQPVVDTSTDNVQEMWSGTKRCFSFSPVNSIFSHLIVYFLHVDSFVWLVD